MPSRAAESREWKMRGYFLPTEAECRNGGTVTSDVEMDSSEMEIEWYNKPPILGNNTSNRVKNKEFPLGKSLLETYLQLPRSTRKVNQLSHHLRLTVAAYWPSDTRMCRGIHPPNPPQSHSTPREPPCSRKSCILLPLLSKSNKGAGSTNRTLCTVYKCSLLSQVKSASITHCQSVLIITQHMFIQQQLFKKWILLKDYYRVIIWGFWIKPAQVLGFL